MRLDDIRNKIDTAINIIRGSSMLVEIRLKDLLKTASPIIKKRARDYSDKVTYRVRLIKKGRNKFYFTVKGRKKKGYNVNIEFLGNATDMTKDDVRVSCTCGYWKYFGCDFNAKQNGYNLRKMSDFSTPDIRDPNREHWICKHIYVTSKALMDYIKNIPKE